MHYETPELLLRCLEALAASDRISAYEVVIVDNGSHGFSRLPLQRMLPSVRVIENPDNRGFAVANNQGLRGATGRYVLLLNPDALVEPDAISRVVSFMDANPDVGCATARLVLPDGTLDLACRRSFPTPLVALYRMTLLSRVFPGSRLFGRYNFTYLPEELETEIDAPCGAFMMVRSATVAQVGLLDEGYFMYGEDLDWAFRIKAAGWRVMYLPSAVVHHAKRASSKRNRSNAIKWFYDAMRRFYATHYEPIYAPPVNWLVYAAIRLRQWVELGASRVSESRGKEGQA